ncbi:flagellar basal body P-ring formation chaperone FlgA [Desulfurobacterium sp.]
MRSFLFFLFVLFLTVLPANGETVKDFIIKYIKDHFPDKAIVFVSAPDRDINPKKIEVTLTSEDRYYLRFRLYVKNNGSEDIIPVNVRVANLRPVVVAAHDILSKSLIRAGDLKVKKVAESRASLGFNSISDVVGKRAKRFIRAGSIIKPSDIMPDYVVFKNAPVKVIYVSGNIRIEMLAQALQNGALGDIIKVKNISTGKKLLCKVIGNGVVEFVP